MERPELRSLSPAEPPHNMEAEQDLLGAILVNNDAIYRVTDFLRGEHFYEPLHGQIFDACHRMISHGRRATPVTLRTEFESESKVGELSVPQYLGRLAANATTIINVDDYGRTVFDLFGRRELIEVAREVLDDAQNAPVDTSIDDIVVPLETKLATLSELGKSQQGLHFFSGALTDTIDMIANAYRRDGGLMGIPTTFRDLDGMLGGFQPSDLIVLAGRPAMGKSALAGNIAFRVARRYMRTKDQENPEGAPVAFFSLEMSAEQVSTRIISEQMEIPSNRLRRGQIDAKDFDEIIEASQRLQNIPLIIDQSGGLSIQQLCSRARRLKVQHGIGLIVIDYLQLLKGTERKRDSRTVEVSEITTGLKALAKELNIPILALSQLSRAVEQRDDKRPILSDLRESGSIEQDADVVMFVFRDEYYVEKREPKENTDAHVAWQADMEACRNRAEVIIGKSRHGPTGTVNLQFTPSLTRFSDLASEERLP